MDYEFHSQLELFQRVLPALRVKEEEFKRLGFSDVKETDIWKYLVDFKWKEGKGLMLSDIVDDILNTDCQSISDYWKEKDSSFSESNIE